MEKLTKVQAELLKRVAAASFADGSGNGLVMYDGTTASVATRLADKGLVSLPAGHGNYFNTVNGVRITPAGRKALAELDGAA